MSSEGNFLKRLRDGIAEFIEGLGMFGEDVKSKAYEKTVDWVANGVVFIIGALFVYLIGATAMKWWDGLQDDKLNYENREIRGDVTNVYTGSPIENVTVGVVGQITDTTRTDINGDFILKFRAHKEADYTDVTFLKEGYHTETRKISIPQNEHTSESEQKFTLEPITQ